MAKRLTEKQKNQIVKNFEDGLSISFLSQQFDCTQLTVIRNLKKNLGEIKFNELNKKNKPAKEKQASEKNKNVKSLNVKHDYEVNNKNLENSSQFVDRSNSDFTPVDSFFEIAPIDYEMDNSTRKELSSVPLSEVDFPKVVYMIVDKKIELEIKYLKEYPEWGFLSQEELNRKTIEIFVDQKVAKRFCNKEQRVIKVPNTKVFKIAAPFLLKKGFQGLLVLIGL